MQQPTTSPWGQVDYCTKICDGIWIISTPSHGGIYVAPELYETMPEPMQSTPYSSGGYFEEDCDWVLPFIVFEEQIRNGEHEYSKKLVEEGVARSRLARAAYFLSIREALDAESHT